MVFVATDIISNIGNRITGMSATTGFKKGLLRMTFSGILILVILGRIDGYAQQHPSKDPYTDSLERQLTVASTDTAKASLLYLLSDYWSYKDSAAALRYVNRALQLNHLNDYYRGLAHFYLAGAYFDHNMERSQLEYLAVDRLLQPYTSKQAYQYRSRAWHNYGVLEQKQDNSRSFTDILLNKAIPLAMQAGDHLRVGWDYADIGMVFMNYKEYKKALYYYDKAIALLRRVGVKSPALADCYINAAKARIFNGDLALAKHDLDSGYALLAKASLPAYYGVEGMYYNRLKQWDSALISLDRGLALAHQMNMPYDASVILFEKYETYKRQSKLPEAKKVLQKVYDQLPIMPLTRNKQLVLFELSQTEAALGNIQAAYRWLLEYSTLSDSLSATKTQTDIATLEATYQTAEKETKILALQNKAKIQKILFSGILLFLICMVLFLIYRFKQRKRQAGQQLKSLQQQQQIDITNALLEGEERERGRLARDLHDGLGGMLAGVKLNLSGMAHHSTLKAQDMELYKVIHQLDDSVDELRRIARNMMPESLLRAGLEVALRDLCESISTDKTKVEYQMLNISSTIPQQIQITIYRIVQELLANVLKHAHAANVYVQCSQSENRFFITVEDDGIGFDQNLIEKKKGIGLENIQSRVGFLQGKLDMDSHPGKGTVINIEIDVTQKS